MSYIIPQFTFGQYNFFGQKIEDGIILYFGNTSVRVCDYDKKSFLDFFKKLEEVREEILSVLN